jgi:predicted AAA+ superfamily ATPase
MVSRLNEARELRGLREAMNALNIAKGIILTYDEEGERTGEGEKIPEIPVWKWLLRK